MRSNRHHIYISGPLTGLPPDEFTALKQLYEHIGNLCEQQGFLAYVPHTRSDPIANADMTPAQVDELDRDAVTYACLVIAYVDKPSLGVGIEVEMAYHANKPVILLHHAQTRVSRLVRGNPSVREIIAFTTNEQLFERLRGALVRFTANGLPANIP